MNKAAVFLFSGQGSHYFSMGKKLFDQNQVFRKWMLNLDDIAQANSGESVIYQLYEKPRQRDELFDRTFYTHPAIFMVEYSLAQTLIERGVIPTSVVGSSLGEFTSAAVAGFLKVEDALKLVIKAEAYFKNALVETCYQQPHLSFFSSLSGTKLMQLPPEYFWEVVRRPISFAKAIQTLEKSGYSNYIDVGPGGTLMNFIKRSLPPTSLSNCYTILSPFHQDVKNITSIIEMFSSLEAENGK